MRREWATEHGLTDVDSPDFDRHLEAVLARMKANDARSDSNGRYDPVAAGYTQFGDPTDSKMGTLNTYLRDAYDNGAIILACTKADQVCVEDGRASGVATTWTDPDTGETRRVTVRAPSVVVACGALETPATAASSARSASRSSPRSPRCSSRSRPPLRHRPRRGPQDR